MQTTAPPPVGVIAHYTLLERLDPAGPGDLYRARDTRLGRTVTVRLLPEGFAPAGLSAGEVIAQAQSIRSLSHPNTTALFDAGEHEGRVYLVFEYLKGQSLRAEMAGGLLPVRRAVDIAIHVADAVGDAHANGFLHGGLSPDSVVITEKGQAKIPAFELATREGFDQDGRLRDYASPEEARGERPDDRADVFSVGAMLYELLTGRRPSPKGSAAPSATNSRVPSDLDAIVLRAVAPNPERRCPSAAALAAELRAVASLLETGVDEDDPVAEPRAGGMRPLAIAAAVLALVVLLVWLAR